MMRKKYGRIMASVLAAAMAVGGYFLRGVSLLFLRRKKPGSRLPRRSLQQTASALKDFLPIIQMSARAIRRLTMRGKTGSFPWRM